MKLKPTKRSHHPIPAPGEVIFTVYSGPDRQGRHGFLMDWWDLSAPQYSKEPGRQHICIGHGPGPRGQAFSADLTEAVERERGRGKTVRVIDSRSAGESAEPLPSF